MLWKKGRRSDNVVQAMGGGGGGGRRIFGGGRGPGLLGIIVIIIISLVFHQNPLTLLGMVSGGGGGSSAPSSAQVAPATSNDENTDFVRVILASTEDVWTPLLAKQGIKYVDPKLVLFNGRVSSACGLASEAMGPFYCPGDQRVYLDLGFFHEMDTRFHATGDFARAYVIAHEVGHHVQKLLGIFAAVEQARQRGAPMKGANGLSVRQELQADCFAGVWAMHAQQQEQWLQPGDIDEALNAASAVGDDTLQRETRGTVVPDSFTHGTSAERARWFKTGFQSGDIGTCDTFKANSL
ncbi:MAG: neutral zinc metallopeptidase [Xanthomonadales bacterium]|nr:neutral zinc metallopeptidase [Xanthomonadales bacterium]